MNTNNQIQHINDLLSYQAKAIRERMLDEAVFNYAPDVVVFDVIGPLGYSNGAASVKDRLQQWLSSFDPEKPIDFELVNVSISATSDMAFSHSYNHVSATLRDGGSLDMFWRETLNWKMIDGAWKIAHSHSSVPFDPTTGKASTGLKP